MVAGKRSRGKPRHNWEKGITDMFGTMTGASRVAEDRHQLRRDTNLGSDVLTRIMLREEKRRRILQKKTRYQVGSLQRILIIMAFTNNLNTYMHD